MSQSPQTTLDAALRLHRAGRLGEAEQLYRQILAANPDHADALQLLGAIAHQVGQHGAAIELISRAVAIEPNHRLALNNLGEALRATGQIEQSVAAFRRAIALDPRYAKGHSNLLLTLHYLPQMDGPALRGEHEQWAKQHAADAPAPPPHTNGREPDRPLRIGYVSPDFRRHSVGYFIEPLLEHHDRERFHVTCYSNHRKSDEVTARLRSHADEWREIVGMKDEAAAKLIRRDGIDILVDLTGHMAGNRMALFARNPAPVQVTYLGYPDGTGLPQIDYRITDAAADPPGVTDDHYVERLIRLPRTAWCYRPPEMSPDVAPAPPDRPVTFASFNKFPKLSAAVVGLWAQILAAVPTSRLLIKAKSLGDPLTRQLAERMLADHGVAEERVELLAWEEGVASHLAVYGRADVALDTFPYNGTTTTCEALWMGVPVVTLAGQMHASRVGASLLGAVKLDDLVAATPEDYVRIAVELASDAARRRELRTTLRDRMRAAPLMDTAGFARAVESAYRAVWRKYCGA